MKIIRAFSIVVLLALVVLAGCTGANVKKKASTKKPPQKEEYDPKIDPKNFVSKIDNRFFALVPGKKFIYEGKSEKGTERIEFYVTRKTKEVMGVTTTVIWDRVWLEGELIEDTKDWFAQDKVGNVWYFGEDSKEYEKGKVVSTKGSWEAGVNGAKPGIVMLANPKVGDTYRQEYYKGEAEDMGDVVALGEAVTVTYGSFKNCLKTRDWSKIDKSLNEYKYYSPEVGFLVLEESVDGKEKVELIGVETDKR